VHASRTVPVASSTFPVAISPAAPDQTFTVHVPFLKLASVVGFGGDRFSQAAPLLLPREIAVALARVSLGVSPALVRGAPNRPAGPPTAGAPRRATTRSCFRWRTG